MSYTVGEAAKIAHVSVRTLHHYDEIGLLEPIARSDAGYRLYSDDDLIRLQQILLYREFDFTLEEIATVLADPDFDPVDALVAQKQLVEEKLKRDEALLALLDKTILSMKGGIGMTKEEMFEVFGEDFDPSEYEEEVQERWGETDAYKESARRTKRYGKQDWARMKAEQDEVNGRMVALYDEGVAANDPRATDVAEEARLLIDKWFYPLSREFHVGLAEMYLADARFTATYEKMREGLAQWWHDAIVANSQRD
ncbi:MAG TPA: MerR family transcriptional regulator [Coriobacteriia bacterium]|nr:MerR family transcriptional regulator [Coriobacteriia bacterium]